MIIIWVLISAFRTVAMAIGFYTVAFETPQWPHIILVGITSILMQFVLFIFVDDEEETSYEKGKRLFRYIWVQSKEVVLNALFGFGLNALITNLVYSPDGEFKKILMLSILTVVARFITLVYQDLN